MKAGIHISSVWRDADLVELAIGVSDGTSFFSNQVYVGYDALEDAVASLDALRDQVHGGLLDIRFGELGPEYANGAFHARFHFPIPTPGRLHVTCELESEHAQFAGRQVASRATLFVRSEPALLDRFISELQAVLIDANAEAHLEAI